MGERTEYAPGTFCWSDLATTDQEGAKGFYSALFGWEAEDMPVGDGTTYSMMRLDGKDAAAIAPQQPEQRRAGVPPVWNSYVSVASTDASADRAKQLGANVLVPPFDVLRAGRMAVIQDPQGAVFMLWESKDMVGAALVNAPGALTWNELVSPDLDASQAFYGGLFGWSFSRFEGSEQPYYTIENGDRTNGGLREPMPPGTPPHWLVYFGIDDAEAGLVKVEELGGKRMGAVIEIGTDRGEPGRIGIAQDPQGAFFALWAGPYGQ